MASGLDSFIWVLNSNNFTPLTRTPWAGTYISKVWKANLLSQTQKENIYIGESWEVSLNSEFSSTLRGTSQTLSEKIKQHKLEDVYGSRIPENEILVKVLNANSPLSVQVHPSDDDPNLKANECGKPESWFIVSAESGSGIYLGFKQNFDSFELRNVINNKSESLETFMQFIPVKAGDYFEITPGVVHAVGPGVTLLEPQSILPEKNGKTFRLWDWNRKYDSYGKLDKVNGQYRDLHIEESLQLIKRNPLHGQELMDEIKKPIDWVYESHKIQLGRFPRNSLYQLELLKSEKDYQDKSNIIELSLKKRSFSTLTVISGQVEIAKGNSHQIIQQGESAFIAAKAFPLSFKISSDFQAAFVHPAFDSLEVEVST